MIDLCERLDIEVLVASRDVLIQVTGFDVHRGVLAAVSRTEQPSLQTILEGTQRLVILEAINDHENIGSIFRNAAALGIDAVLLDARTSDPFYRRSIRVSLGHVLSTPWTRVENFDTALQQVRDVGFRLVGLTPDAQAREVGTAATQGTLDSPVAFVLGAEGPGLSAETLQFCDALVRIPMSDGVDSLNVATSLAVVASFAIARTRI
jgi:tRNA G18 (ribose-2'-O)-methylase SpoU